MGASRLSASRFVYGLRVDGLVVWIRPLREVDLGARHVQKTQRISGSQGPRLVGADDVVRYGRHGGH